MELECPYCNTKYRLTKVPSAKVMATCKKCGQKFQFNPPNAIKQIKPQQEEKTKSAQETSQWYKRKGLILTMVLTLLVIGVATGGIRQLYNNFLFKKEVVNKSIENKINYWGESIPETVTINNIQYTLIDDYIKWAPILYQNKDFDAVEEHISDLLQTNDETKSYELQTLYSIISKIPDENSIDQMQTVLDEWCNKHAHSHIPWLVRGSFYIEYAWLIRGGGLAKTVKKRAWPKFYEKMRLAKNDLQRSWELNPNDPNSSSSLIKVAIGLKFPKQDMEQYFQRGISACPWHFQVHLDKLQYLNPKWYGSKNEMFTFAEQCLALSEQYPYLGLVMVEALYEVHRFGRKGENFLGSDDIWPTVEKVCAAFFARYPNNIRRRFYYAYHAYNAKKYDVALEQFEIIGDRWMEHTCWNSLEYYNKSRAISLAKVGEDFLLKKRLYEISIDYFKKAVKHNPNDYTYYRLGQAYMYSGLSSHNLAYLQQAEETLQKAIQVRGSNEKHAKGELKKLRKYLRK
jgi:tetratricopeptide (TPR) repeat protein